MRLPLAPLFERAGLDRVAFAEQLGVSIRSVERTATAGMLADKADRWATRLGYHPHQIWGDAYDRAEDWFAWWGRYKWPIPAALLTISPWVEPEPGGRFCGRHPDTRAGRPHTCATDGCACPTASRRTAA